MYKKGKVVNLDSILQKRVMQITRKKLVDFQKIIRRVLFVEESKYFREVSGAMNHYNKPTLPGFEKVTWKRLANSTVKRKGDGRKWYSGKSGGYGNIHLKDLLKQVDVADYFPKDEIKIGELKQRSNKRGIKVMTEIIPALSKNRRPFSNFLSGGYDKSKTQEDKITGEVGSTGKSNEFFRPLFDPMREYYVRHKLPRAINAALKRELFK